MNKHMVKGFFGAMFAVFSLFIKNKVSTLEEPNIGITPSYGEILFIDRIPGGRLVASERTEYFSNHSGRIIPLGFFYPTFIPDIFIGNTYMFKEQYYLNPDNIYDFNNPLMTGDDLMLFRANECYTNQVKKHILYFTSCADKPGKVFMQCVNTITAEHRVPAVGNVEIIAHELFDCAYISHITGEGYDYWDFKGYKEIESVFYYDFDRNTRRLTEDNLHEYLKEGTLLEYDISFFVPKDKSSSVVVSKEEVLKMIEGLKIESGV